MRKLLFLLLGMLPLICPASPVQDTLRVDLSAPAKSVVRRPVGINLFMLMDHDSGERRARPMQRALRDLGVRSVRFNEGEYGDWYLFTHPDSLHLLTCPDAPLYPTLIDIKSRGIDGRLTDIDAEPQHGGYPLNRPGYRPTVDFNDFLRLCRRTGADDATVIIPTHPVDRSLAKPFYPTREEMVRSAAAMVRYANRVCRAGIRFWEIGNEHYWENRNDAHDAAWARRCASLILEMARAMKTEDPTIEIGVNGFTPAWLEALLGYTAGGERLIDWVDNVVPHQYAKRELIGDYALYSRSAEYPLHEVDVAAAFLDRSDAPDAGLRRAMKLEVTEASSFMPGDRAHLVDNVAWVALANFEHLGYVLAAPRVEYVHFWATHWTDDKTYWSALRLDNTLAPMGWGVKLWNDHLLDRLWKADLHSPSVRCYASASADGGRLTLFLVNRLDRELPCRVELRGWRGSSRFRTSGITAGRPDDRDFRMQRPSSGRLAGDAFERRLAPLSVTVVEIGK